MPVPNATNPIANPRSAQLFRIAYLATSVERAALSENQLRPVARDVQVVILMILDDLPHLPPDRAGQLETYARALAYAETVYLAVGTPSRAADRQRAYTLALNAYEGARVL